MSERSTYELYRTKFGVLDSIRFMARETGRKPIEVARLLGLADYFLRSMT